MSKPKPAAARQAAAPPPVPAPAPAPATTPPALFGTDRLDALIRIGETDVQLGEFVRAAFFEAAPPLSAQDWNALSDDDRHARIVAQVEIARAAIENEPVTEEPVAEQPEETALAEAADPLAGEPQDDDDEPTEVVLKIGLAGETKSYGPRDTFPCTMREARRLRLAGFADK